MIDLNHYKNEILLKHVFEQSIEILFVYLYKKFNFYFSFQTNKNKNEKIRKTICTSSWVGINEEFFIQFICIYFSILEKTIDQNKICFFFVFLSNVLIRFNKKK